MALAVALAFASVVWLGLLALGAAGHLELIHQAASSICHQSPERSFSWHGHQWPVCGRCLGLYAAAPAGAFVALLGPRSLTTSRRNFLRLCIAALPTAVTFVLEHAAGLPLSNVHRFGAALPLGAMVAWLLVRTARDSGTHVSQYTLSDARRGESR